jgi:hypothetical protein
MSTEAAVGAKRRSRFTELLAGSVPSVVTRIVSGPTSA